MRQSWHTNHTLEKSGFRACGDFPADLVPARLALHGGLLEPLEAPRMERTRWSLQPGLHLIRTPVITSVRMLPRLAMHTTFLCCTRQSDRNLYLETGYVTKIG